MTALPPVFARHGFGWDLYKGRVPTTFMFSDEALTKPLGWQSGHVSEGSVWGEYGEARRVVVPVAQGRAA